MQALGQGCESTGSCTSQAVDPNNPFLVNYCFASGVKNCSTADATTGAMVTTVYKPDGVTVCYRMEMTLSTTGATTKFMDASGAQVATGSSSFTGTSMSLTCTSDGQTYSLAFAMPTCTAGACACP
jgi:hypothetical protein